MALLRSQAMSYGIDPHKIGVIGFSVGSHLVTNMGNDCERTYPVRDAADRMSPRPDFAIVAYTARALDTSKGKNELELAPWVKINPEAPPTLIIHAMNDPTDNIRQSMPYALALNDAGMPVDIRLYAKGGHAFGMRPTAHPITKEWPGGAGGAGAVLGAAVSGCGGAGSAGFTTGEGGGAVIVGNDEIVRSTGSTLGGVGLRACFSTGLGGVSDGEASGSSVTTSGAEGLGGGVLTSNDRNKLAAISA